MTKSELKQIIKSLIVESINESKNSVSIKKTKKLKEQEEIDELPMDPQASAEPDAGEVEGPETAEEGEHADLLAQIDNIQQTLADLRASIQRHSIGKDETESEVESPENEIPPQVDNVEESSDEELEDEDDFVTQYDDDESMKNMLAWQRTSGERLGYAKSEEEDDFEDKLKYGSNLKKSKNNPDKISKYHIRPGSENLGSYTGRG